MLEVFYIQYLRIGLPDTNGDRVPTHLTIVLKRECWQVLFFKPWAEPAQIPFSIQ